MRAAVVTVSDGVSAGVREDASGDVLAELLSDEGFDVERIVVPDDVESIADAISAFGDVGVVRAGRQHRDGAEWHDG